jgi:uncharacterized protein YlxW (UPF0749 family)
MSRRTQRSELEFGSDSFLDVVCNIVGILIILIVVVGVRVQRQPVKNSVVADPDPQVMAAAVDRVLKRQQEQDALVTAAERKRDELRKQQEQLEAESKELETSLQKARSEASKLELEASAVEQQTTQKNADRESLSRRVRQLQGERAAIQARIASLAKSLDAAGTQQRSIEAALVTIRDRQQQATSDQNSTIVETQKLEEILEGLSQKTQPANRLEHRLSPVTRSVESDEFHFRVEGGRVSRIPLEELLERLKAQVLSRRSAILRFNQFEGTVGPLGGYTMKYTVEKEGPSTLEALQTGDGRVRVNVSRWEIVPEESRVDETVEAAVKPGGRLREQLETCPPDSVVTLWVYEDSFEVFSPIRELAHSLSLRVAARPLPTGSPIVGSPNGSRSTAQ